MTPETFIIAALVVVLVVLVVLYVTNRAMPPREGGSIGCTAHHFTDFKPTVSAATYQLKSGNLMNEDGEHKHILLEEQTATCEHRGCTATTKKKRQVAEAVTDEQTFDNQERLALLVENMENDA